MNTEQKLSYSSKSLEETNKLGKAIAQSIVTPILIELVGDLGGGKTALVKSIARGLGITQTVTSPTFNIHREYKSPSGKLLQHFDLYRLSDDEIVQSELNDALADSDSVVCVEWAQHFTKHASANRLVINCHYVSENERNYEISAFGQSALAAIKEISK